MGGEKVAKSGRSGRNRRDDQEMPEALVDGQKAEEALREAKNRSKRC